MNTKKDRKKIVIKRVRALALVLCVGVALAISMQGLLSFPLPTKEEKNKSPWPNYKLATSEIRATKSKNPFENILLEARAVYVLRLNTNTVLYAKNENEKLPLASITKLMTALVARERFKESAVVVLSADDISEEGDSGLRVGERWRIGDLLDVLLIVSSNDAAHAIARFVGANGQQQTDSNSVSRANFIKIMNDRAHATDLLQTEFFNESGLDINESQNGGYGSARNVALLFSELWKKYPETIEVTAHKDARIVSQDNIVHVLPNTNEIVGHIPGLIASKTGFTDITGGNLAVIFDRGLGDPIVVVVLGSSYKGRFEDMQKLVSVATTFEVSEK